MGDEDTDEVQMVDNHYLKHLNEWRNTVLPNCRDALAENGAAPEQQVATQVAAGWDCTAADDWIAELREICSGITGAFDDAVAAVSSETVGQDAQVESDDWRGLPYQRAQTRIRNWGRGGPGNIPI